MFTVKFAKPETLWTRNIFLIFILECWVAHAGGPIAAAAADTARNAAAVVLGCQDGIEGGQLTAASAAAQVVES